MDVRRGMADPAFLPLDYSACFASPIINPESFMQYAGLRVAG